MQDISLKKLREVTCKSMDDQLNFLRSLNAIEMDREQLHIFLENAKGLDEDNPIEKDLRQRILGAIPAFLKYKS
jgi:hypothetical protein